MTFRNRKGPDESQICRKTVQGSRIGEGAVTDGCTTCGRTRTSAVDNECSQQFETTSDTDSGRTSLIRYCGAAPLRQRCTRTHNLYWIRSGIQSQCKFASSGVTWLNLRAPAVRRAAAFSTDWIWSSSPVQRRRHCIAVVDFRCDEWCK